MFKFKSQVTNHQTQTINYPTDTTNLKAQTINPKPQTINHKQFLDVMTDTERARVGATVGPFLWFDSDVCSGRYRLDLGERFQRLLARTLQACGNTENVRATRFGVADTSAKGNRQRIVRVVVQAVCFCDITHVCFLLCVFVTF